MPEIETYEHDGKVQRVKADLIPCQGGPLTQLRLHRPYDQTIPCSDGKYRLHTQGGKAVYIYEPEGRGRKGHGPDS